MKKIIILIPCWNRVNVVKLVSKQLDIFYEANKDKVDIEVLWILSPEDPKCHEIARVFTDAKHTRTMELAPNNRLGEKLNIGIRKANDMGYDYLMNMGSDDLLHESLIDLYLPYMEKENKLFGLSNLYVYNQNGETMFFNNYNKPYVVGAARMIHREVIEKVIKEFGCLYEPTLRRAMDGNSANRMIKCGYVQTPINTGDFPMLVDIKAGTNINNYASVARTGFMRKLTKEVNRNVVEDVFPILKNLKRNELED